MDGACNAQHAVPWALVIGKARLLPGTRVCIPLRPLLEDGDFKGGAHSIHAPLYCMSWMSLVVYESKPRVRPARVALHEALSLWYTQLKLRVNAPVRKARHVISWCVLRLG